MPTIVPSTVFFDLDETLVTGSGGILRRFDDALDTLQILTERGYRIGLISNQPAGITVAQLVSTQLTGLGLHRYVETGLITIPNEVPGNAGKPARPIFDLALAKAGHPAASNRAIFVTETAAHIQAARGFGWRAILLRTAGTCLAGDGECVVSLGGLVDLLPPLAKLAGTNLDLAPRPKMVDGLWAVPIDITRISGVLTFNAATQVGSGDATIDFRLGRYAGCPIFDLRQTVTGVWLDGSPVPAADAASHDFGGGADASLRVLARVLDAGSVHTLRMAYRLGLPQASTAGSYQPHITWAAGPRLAFNFGFTDLGAGRYLEAFVPANLIYDQFELVLEIRLLNTAIAHTPITNGTVTSLAANSWRFTFPARFSALSPMLELRAADTLANATVNTTLPISGRNVAVTAWKLATSPVDVAAQATAIGGFLGANEQSTGQYLHGDRFTAFVHQGGMEYEGGTTSSVGPLRHETFHSWWARGVKPASQPDAWMDEGWTVYNDNGAAGVTPFNFADPAVELRSPNPWARVTASAAYSAGERLWRGIAALVGAATLRDRMSQFYRENPTRPVTTASLEEFLVAQTGEPTCVDAFHRFAYGFADPAPLPDLWLRDDPGHAGEENWPGRFWDSPDLWVRNRDDGGVEHQNPEFGQDNWFYARVRNRSATATARHLVVTFNVKSFAGSQFVYPADFLPAVGAAAGFDLGPQETRILKARWPRASVPPPGTHSCLLATVLTRFDHPVASRRVWEQNNLAQKNLTVVDLAPNAWIILPVVVANLQPRLSRRVELEIIRPTGLQGLQASLLTDRLRLAPTARAAAVPLPAMSAPLAADDSLARLDCGCPPVIAHASADEVSHATRLTGAGPVLPPGIFPAAVETKFPAGPRAKLPIVLRPQERAQVGLRIIVPPGAKRGSSFTVDLVQREGDRIVGGVALRVKVA